MSQYDSLNLRVTDLRKGFMLDYDLNTWEVTQEYEYDWGNEFYTREYKIVNGREERYLSVEVDDEIDLALWQKINLAAIDRNLASYIMSNDEPPRELSLGGVSYHRTEESLGYWRNTSSSNWQKFINWDYENADGDKYISLERWGEEEFEASTGIKVKEYEISNILPREGSPNRAPRDYVERKKKSQGFFFAIMIGVAFIFFGATRCNNSSSGGYEKNPVDLLIQDMMDHNSFSVILYDMDLQSAGWSNQYMHKYLVLKTLDSSSSPEQFYTDWQPVNQSFFNQHKDHLGMELASKKEGEAVNKETAPPGWGSYVGNERYGEWKTNSNGETFWSFYGKYMFMSSMFHLATRPIYRSYYNDYYGGYYGRGRTYFGPTVGGSSYYGTNSSYTQKTRPDFFTRRKQKNGFTSTSSSRRTRSSSRWGGGGSYRSRGGGFGK